MLPRFPVFVPTKGRWETPYTIWALQQLGVPFKAVVEPQQAEDYLPVVGEESLLVLPHRDQGLVVTRNWIWDYAASLGVERFWTFDDNIKNFYRLHRNIKYKLGSPTFLYILEDFALRYSNLPIFGMAYQWLAKQNQKIKPLVLNTRVYSNMLIETFAHDRNGWPFRNEGFYNDDTDLCLRILKDGQCTCQTNVYLIDKCVTMTLKGGMTEHYLGDGRYKMALELQQKHSDVVTITRKFGRWQHQVNYKPFRHNKLCMKPGTVVPTGIQEYNMIIANTHSQEILYARP